MSTMEERLDKAVKLREQLSSELQRMLGKKQAAEQSLQEVEQEIRNAKLDPNTLDDTLVKLEQAFTNALEDFETQLTQAQDLMSKYMEKP